MSKRNLNKLLKILDDDYKLALKQAKDARKKKDNYLEDMYSNRCIAINMVLLKYAIGKKQVSDE